MPPLKKLRPNQYALSTRAKVKGIKRMAVPFLPPPPAAKSPLLLQPWPGREAQSGVPAGWGQLAACRAGQLACPLPVTVRPDPCWDTTGVPTWSWARQSCSCTAPGGKAR